MNCSIPHPCSDGRMMSSSYRRCTRVTIVSTTADPGSLWSLGPSPMATSDMCNVRHRRCEVVDHGQATLGHCMRRDTLPVPGVCNLLLLQRPLQNPAIKARLLPLLPSTPPPCDGGVRRSRARRHVRPTGPSIRGRGFRARRAISDSHSLTHTTWTSREPHIRRGQREESFPKPGTARGK